MKEIELLDIINELYKKVKGELINIELLYSGSFIDVIKETYKLPNGSVVLKEKIVKNKGKNSLIVIPITIDNDYIITFQSRIDNKMIAEFPSGYIEENEDVVEAAKRELLEETGYISDDFFIIDEVFTSPGIDNSTTYIVIALCCIKACEKQDVGTELVDYSLFNEDELEYLVTNRIMSGAINRLAYFNLKNNKEKIYYKRRV